MKIFFTLRSLFPGRLILARMTSIVVSASLVLTLVMSGPSLAHADYWDDVKAKAKQCGEAALDQGSLALDVVGTGPRIAACASTLAGSNAAGITITGLVAGLYLAGKFDTEDQCNGLLVTTIAEQLGKLIAASPSVKSAIIALIDFLVGEGKGNDAIDVFLKMAAGDAVNVMQEIDGAQVLFGYFGCACTVIGGSAELQKQMDKANDSKNECLGPIGDVLAFFEDLHGEILGFLIGLIPDVQVFATPDLGVHYYVTPDAPLCPLGVAWSSGEIPYTKVYAEYMKGELVLPDNAGALFEETGMCICPSGTLPKMEADPHFANKVFASCGCPEGEKFDANMKCVSQCEYGTKYDYKVDHKCEPICKYGVYMGKDAKGNKVCETSCDDPEAVFDWNKGKCEVCGPNSRTVRTGVGADDKGYCEACGYDAKLTDQNTCQSYCENDWTVHKVNFAGIHSCEMKCGPGMLYNPGIELKPFTCTPCAEGTQLDPNTNTCTPCAQGATWTPASTAAFAGPQCQCPTGQAPIDGVCKTCPGGAFPVNDGSGNLVCPACPSGDCAKDTPRIACYLKNGKYDANNRTCTPCGDDAYSMGTICVSKKPTKFTAEALKTPKPGDVKDVSLAPCAGTNEVRDMTTLQCVPCADDTRAIGNRCIPNKVTTPGSAQKDAQNATPIPPQTLLEKCQGDNEVRDPYTLRCVKCGDTAYAFNGACLAYSGNLSIPKDEPLNKTKLVSLDPSQKSCPAGTYPLGEKYCQQDILPQGQTAAGRCSPKGANQVFDGRANGGCTPCGAGTSPNADRTACVRLAARTPEPTRPASGKAVPAKTDPAARGAAVKPDDKPDAKGTAVKPKKQEIKGSAVTPKLPEGAKPKSIAPDLDSDGPSIGSRPGVGTPSLPSGGIGAAPGGNRKP